MAFLRDQSATIARLTSLRTRSVVGHLTINKGRTPLPHATVPDLLPGSQLSKRKPD